MAEPTERDRPLWRIPLCLLGMCGHRANGDDTGVWGECVTCGRRAGYVTREELRRYADREIAARIRQGDAA